ncbi:STAS domain-containing protein [Thiosulfatimonas sediminis]|uniref:STAS domain-containing protein n=1 Tax=Thiosulfatimonas sediminis TaxID=2675054 RepID=UPI001565AE23|nr:hypothetical protein [Thiosulfatimonas sediminis]
MASEVPSLNWQPETGCLTLPVNLTILNLDAWIKQHKVLQLPVVAVDFSENQKMDSSILAMIVHWALQSTTLIQLHNCPSQASTLIDLYDLQELVRLD